MSGNSVPALIRHGSETSLPTNLWSQRASVSIDSEATEDDEADRRGSLVNESSPRRGSKLLDFLDKKKKDKKRYKDKQGKGVSDFKACRDRLRSGWLKVLSTDLETIALSLNLFERPFDFFSAACHLIQIGRKIQIFSTSFRIFKIIHPRF